jgi:cysteinyl-tRNA synthetase
MHNGMVELGEAKMAKSVGNIRQLHGALDEVGRDALLMYFCGGHYRQPLAFSAERLEEAAARVARVREAGRRLPAGPSPADLAPLCERFWDALAADFNTAEALGALFEWVREANRRAAGEVGDADLREMLGVLGLANLLEAGAGEAADADAAARDLLDRREAARAARDFAMADRLRDELSALGWEVRDGPAGPALVRR